MADIFTQTKSILDDDLEAPANAAQTIRAQERQAEQLPGTPAPAPLRKLMAVYSQQGQLLVARTVNGNQDEGLRPPTATELALLEKNGVTAAGLLGEVDDEEEDGDGFGYVALAIAAVVGVTAGAVGYHYVRGR